MPGCASNRFPERMEPELRAAGLADARVQVLHAFEVTRAADIRAMVLIGSGDKVVPGMVMAAARLDLPSIMLYGGPTRAGTHNNRKVFLETVYDGVGEHLLGKLTREDLEGLEDNHFPFAGACDTATSGNTAGIHTARRCGATHRTDGHRSVLGAADAGHHPRNHLFRNCHSHRSGRNRSRLRGRRRVRVPSGAECAQLPVHDSACGNHDGVHRRGSVFPVRDEPPCAWRPGRTGWSLSTPNQIRRRGLLQPFASIST